VAGALLVTQGGALRTVASYGLANPEALVENRLLVSSLESAEPVVVHLPQGIDLDRVVATSSAVEAVVLPLRANSIPIGLLLLTLEQPATAGQLSLLAMLAAPLGLAVENAAGREALESLAAHDSLTGLCNRRFADAQLRDEYARAVRGHVPLGLLMLDLDHFKAVNDTYGHLTGDKVLKAIAAAAASVLRPGDSIARFGGEEFLILLPSADLGNARDVAERIRLVVSGLQLRAPDLLPTVTVSIGVTSWPEIDAQSEGDLMRMADEALFAAKQAGRNRVAVAGLSAGAEPALDDRAQSAPLPSMDQRVAEPVFDA
ncbi:MAG: GGDEF domain-containing protein, partial [Candidatus Dormibacteria bacterium]